jgi:nucleotide-binding universal stress UspA family protein
MENLFAHILVPLDFTAKNAAAVNVASRLGQQCGARVTLLHVIETIEHATGKEIEDFYATLEGQARKKLAEAESSIADIADAELAVQSQILYGRRGPEIVRYAQDNAVDLVVMSSHPIDMNQPAKSWATLSYQVATFCPCPVLLVK